MKAISQYRIGRGVVGLLALLLAVGSVGISHAQPTPEQMKQRMSQRVDGTIDALALKGERADTVRVILQAGMDKQVALMTAARSGNGQDFQSMRAKRTEIDAEVQKQLSSILSKEEMQKYKAYMETQNMRGNRRGGRGDSRK